MIVEANTALMEEQMSVQQSLKLIAVFTKKLPTVLSAPLYYRALKQENHMIFTLFRYDQRVHLLKEAHL